MHWPADKWPQCPLRNVNFARHVGGRNTLFKRVMSRQQDFIEGGQNLFHPPPTAVGYILSKECLYSAPRRLWGEPNPTPVAHHSLKQLSVSTWTDRGSLWSAAQQISPRGSTQETGRGRFRQKQGAKRKMFWHGTGKEKKNNGETEKTVLRGSTPRHADPMMIITFNRDIVHSIDTVSMPHMLMTNLLVAFWFGR